jgi:isoleucyl-tRNA synthetase
MKNEMSEKLYREVDSSSSLSQRELEIQKQWQQQDTFRQSIRGDSDFIFYDGPPFANGLPHYGHLLTGFIKDLFARYQATQGKRVERRFGWDCHGLPAEMGAEKELGISGRIAIENFGIAEFNQHCRTSVLKYTEEWQHYVERQGRWVDFENDYKTMDISYMESVIWAFKQLYDKGLVYESQRVMPYSWACQTPVSDFETRMDNSYREKSSKATTVLFPMIGGLEGVDLQGVESLYFMAWTTTPWTLPSNLALAVGEDIDYAIIKHEGRGVIIAQALAPRYEKEIGAELVATVKGKGLVGKRYQPLFDYFKDHPNAFQVLPGEFVTTEDGTGVVHMAPGFGEDDQKACAEYGIDVVCPVDEGGHFTFPVADFEGKHVFDSNDEVIKALKLKGLWLRTEQYLHNYPHCWRTDEPLIYKAVPSWYVEVTKFRDRMVKNNQDINWIPGHIKDGQFGKWIANARDWSISRNRFWGCPIPVWKSDDPKYPNIEVYGSIAELEEAFGVEVKDLHRPAIDELVRPNPKDPTGKSMMRRVTDVLDCWFESGSMPYAQLHYPFENREYFEKNFPADFIVEYVAQTRGWFYTLMVLSTALFDRAPFKNCICHGVILGDDGHKLSKRLKNYPDPNEVFEKFGADAMRWYMMSSPVMRGNELRMDAKGVQEKVRSVIKPLWNAYNFFTLYANVDGVQAKFDTSSKVFLDKYILSKCYQTVAIIEKSLDAYDTIDATKAVEEFLEVLNNWYIRRSRERFWRGEIDADKVQAYNTLYSVLILICRAASPLLPMTLEDIYQGLVGSQEESVHLQVFPDVAEFSVDAELIEDMERVRDACTAALHVRNDAEVRVRQPLAKVTFIGVSERKIPEELNALIMDEINVKAWDSISKEEIARYADFRLKINFPLVGKRIPTKVKDIIAANKNSQWVLTDGKIEIAGQVLEPQEFEFNLLPKAEYAGQIAALASNDALVLLDLEISEELKLEGYARDIVRAIQQARKNANLGVTDRIRVAIGSGDADIAATVAEWAGFIKEQTLATDIAEGLDGECLLREEVAIGDGAIELCLVQADDVLLKQQG